MILSKPNILSNILDRSPEMIKIERNKNPIRPVNFPSVYNKKLNLISEDKTTLIKATITRINKDNKKYLKKEICF